MRDKGEITTTLHTITLHPDMDAIRLHSVGLCVKFGTIQMPCSARFVTGQAVTEIFSEGISTESVETLEAAADLCLGMPCIMNIPISITSLHRN
jgi:hypothetical protein